jgi:hypothetical protein
VKKPNGTLKGKQFSSSDTFNQKGRLCKSFSTELKKVNTVIIGKTAAESIEFTVQ